ncbi:MAG TPA: MBL fold metallo-hydrolase [Vicinamibacteria bacterium]|nr:MBL fold metallo-hydrolase [Vicinamibacteria bacterium]
MPDTTRPVHQGPGRLSARVALPFFWRRLRASAQPRAGAALLVPFDPAALESGPAVTWIGHATFYVRLDGAGFLTDPIYSERASPLAFAGPRRMVPPGVPLPALPRIDFALLTHDHYDHSDLPTMRELAGRGVPFVVPSGLAALVSRAGGRVAAELGWWQTAEVAGLRVICVPARHFSGRGLRGRNRTLWCGFVVSGGNGRVYHAGDSALFAGFAEVRRRLAPIDVALLPIGAYEPQAMMHPIHLDPEEAARAASDVDARVTVGMHWGTFDLADEPPDEPPRRFLAEASRLGLQRRARVMAVGETLAF